MDAPEPTPAAAGKRRISRRNLFKLAGGAIAAGLTAETLRVTVFTNVHTVISGRVYRTAQLKPEQLQSFIAEKGIRTVVNLRGICKEMPWYLNECRVTHTAGINQEDITLSAKRFPAPSEVERLVDVLDHTAYPIVFHCQRGADRTGLASTVARLILTNDSLFAARRQMWPRYGHIAAGRTAVLDEFFDYYESWLAARGEVHTSTRFRQWVNQDYCPGPYRTELSLAGPTQFVPGRGFIVTVRARNTSIEPWQFMTGKAGGLRLRFTITALDNTQLHTGHAGHFTRTVKPGESIDFACGVPPLPPGIYLFSADFLVTEPITLLNTAFTQYGSEPLAAPIVIA